MAVPIRPDERWSLDFVSDCLNSGRRFRMLAVIDDGTRACPAAVADTSFSGRGRLRERWRRDYNTVRVTQLMRACHLRWLVRSPRAPALSPWAAPPAGARSHRAPP